MIHSILLLQFACMTEGDEAEAKLARQLPRTIGKKLNATGVIEAQFLSVRHEHEGKVFFLNSTGLPDKQSLAELARSHQQRYILFGKSGAGQRITIDAQIYDAEKDSIVFRKFFETYATYTLDALDEIAYRAITVLQTELSEEQRTAMFRRETTSWEAFLYYLLAEDDRYGISVGIPPHDSTLAVAAYFEALSIDPSMQSAELGLISFLIESLSCRIMDPERALEYLSTLIQQHPDCEAGYEAQAYILLALGKTWDAESHIRHALLGFPDSLSLHKTLSEILLEQGRVQEGRELLIHFAEREGHAAHYTLLADFYHSLSGQQDFHADWQTLEQEARARAEEIRSAESPLLPLLSKSQCSLN